MPVLSPHRSNGYRCAGTTVSTPSASSDRPPYYSSGVPSTRYSTFSERYTSRAYTDIDGRRVFSRSGSITEDGVTTRFHEEGREGSVLRRESMSRDNGTSLNGLTSSDYYPIGRRESSITSGRDYLHHPRLSTLNVIESVAEMRNKYSPANYVPACIRNKYENISRSRSNNDIGGTTTTNTTPSVGRYTSTKSKVLNDVSQINGTLDAKAHIAKCVNTNEDGVSDACNGIATTITTTTSTTTTTSKGDDTNGNDGIKLLRRKQSNTVADLRKRFDDGINGKKIMVEERNGRVNDFASYIPVKDGTTIENDKKKNDVTSPKYNQSTTPPTTTTTTSTTITSKQSNSPSPPRSLALLATPPTPPPLPSITTNNSIGSGGGGGGTSINNINNNNNNNNDSLLRREKYRHLLNNNNNNNGLYGSTGTLNNNNNNVQDDQNAPSTSAVTGTAAGAATTSTALTSSTTKVSGLNGLKNIGNTCFMNSVIQCLSNTKLLLEYLRNDGYVDDINTTTSSMKGALIKAFAEVIKELWSDDSSDRVVNTTNLKSQIQRFAPRFIGYAQQDAQEFLRYLLEGLHEDVNRVIERPKPIHTEIDERLSDTDKSAESWSRYLRIDNSKIVDCFVGQLKSTLKCTHCGHCSVTFDPFWDLSLPIPQRTGQVRLSQCLDSFTREETLDGDEKPTCSKCKERRKCTKSFTIQKFPRILVIHLKRFSPTERYRGKLNVTVDFPLEGLDMSQYAADHVTACHYNLYAISNHSGTTYSGHYTAYCRHPYAKTWHEYNDSRVSSISSRSLVSGEAYVLFYEASGKKSHL